MPTPDSIWIYASTIGVYLIVLLLPGGFLGWAAGLRGWALFGMAPLFTYLAAGLAGPWLAVVGLPFNPGTAAAVVLLLAAAALGLRRLAQARGWAPGEPDRPPVPWSRRAHLAVGACVLLATVLSVIVVLSAAGGASAIFQRWDTVYHANGIRYIAETGDGSLFGMSTINWYPDGSYYPNGYHLVGSLVYTLSGAAVPTVLNAVTVPVAGLFALSMVAMVRQFGGRAVLAGSAAVVAGAATSGAYESVSSGLLPFALGIVLTPLAALALDRFLRRPAPDTGMVLALAGVGLLVAHTSALVGAILFAFPLVVQRWWRREGKPLADLARVAPVGLGAALLAAPHLLGAVSFGSGSFPYNPWASDVPLLEAVSQLVLFRQFLTPALIWLSACLLVGVLMIRTLHRLRWIGFSALLLSGIFVLVASYGGLPWVITFSRPWWNDRYRLMALAAIPLCLLAAHGLAEAQRLLAKWAAGTSLARQRTSAGAPANALGPASAVLLIVTMAVVTNGFYSTANARVVGFAYQNWPESRYTDIPVTRDEVAAMLRMGELARPGEMVLNGRTDGTAWLYAITGVRPVAGHYDANVVPPDAAYLAAHFREYQQDPKVRAAVRRLNIRHVLLGSGSVLPDLPPEPGLRDLEGLPFLKQVYRNSDAVIYALRQPG
ncbi:DUF6541 family protein [Amycolatopsis cihanbeyliensis]|uniref:Copper-transporting ATPase n=1 Tax=Amycolatopsis cihanbeyliensis TaxID=1128664 RepID=A0A542DM53_AMYCI|nr:DUF6541 family protein [Amycolatopsis cihanbeyliensis]TQJ04171.1 hypothetical protein FB471_3953 [Amycolatopsis cihanbeyliensis]